MVEHGVDHIAWVGTKTKICDRVASEFVANLPCLEQTVSFEPKGKIKPGHAELNLEVFTHINANGPDVEELYP
jgi:hypothetical protein